MSNDTRYPYTYAADYIRSLAGYNENGTKISRSDASMIIHHIAMLMEMDKESLANTIADAELEKTDEDHRKAVMAFLEEFYG